ncbi:hypothetical protein M8C17_14315 [Micromonospora sp. RHAY321]|uniref:hypothetical protein n=1 Tax=Micromonospora sp. RHAY321 TaxID=2944807 RepID=UPI00207C253F|nr:hypothetical protein [Micromonospora sp. RHAY321]MCO1596333.1 hypothetical protein [Micromonospora sp. RHAY321]
MTTEGFREVDDDLLADYLGGALDGTPQQAEVARLVDTDPGWAQAYALLAPAVTEVRADLARWAEPSLELPSAVAERIAAALAAADPVPDDTETGEDTEPAPGAPTRVVLPVQGGSGPGRPPAGPFPVESERGTPTGPGRRRRRWVRRGAPAVAVAAVAVIGVGLGLNQLSRNASDTADTTALNQPASAPEGAAAAGAVRTTGPALHSGTDYTPQMLGDATVEPSARQQASGFPDEQPRVDAEEGRRPSPNGLDPLARLTDEAALTTCLADVAAEHGAAPLVVEVIDYAQFRGEPALVIRFTDAAGLRWAWVTGPECGVPGSGSDSRYSARVG